MVIVLYGTIGEYIKLYPLLERLGSRDSYTINLNMQPEQMRELFRMSQVPQPNKSILNGHAGEDINTTFKMLIWVFQLLYELTKLRKKIRTIAKAEKTTLIVHGDTIIAPIGAFFGRFIYRLPIAHIEAGYRSGNWRRPFPEEIDRIITDHLATVNYAVGEETIKHLRPPKTKSRIVDTQHNTIVDALTAARQKSAKKTKLSFTLPPNYVLVSMHRSENIGQKDKMTELVRALNHYAKKGQSIIWLDHAPTKERLKAYELDDWLRTPNIRRIPKQPYFQFVRLISEASAIITDSGGLQEEAYILGIPCLIHREINEKMEMGILSYLKENVLREFLATFESIPHTPHTKNISPTHIIIEDLKDYGFIKGYDRKH